MKLFSSKKPMDVSNLGKVNYDSFYRSMGGRAADDTALKEWKDLPRYEQVAWHFASQAVAETVLGPFYSEQK